MAEEVAPPGRRSRRRRRRRCSRRGRCCDWEPGSVAAARAWVPQVSQRATSDCRPAEHQRQGVEEQRQPEARRPPRTGRRRSPGRAARRPRPGSPSAWRATAGREKWASISRRYAECIGGSDSIGSWAVGRMSCSGGIGTRNGVADVNVWYVAADPAHVAVAQEHRELGPVDCRVEPAGGSRDRTERVVRIVGRGRALIPSSPRRQTVDELCG